MARKLLIRGERREQVDKEKLAIAFLMLARILHEQEREADNAASNEEDAEGT